MTDVSALTRLNEAGNNTDLHVTSYSSSHRLTCDLLFPATVTEKSARYYQR